MLSSNLFSKKSFGKSRSRKQRREMKNYFVLTFVIIGACNRSGNVSWDNCDHGGGEKAGTRILSGEKNSKPSDQSNKQQQNTQREGGGTPKNLELLGEVVGDDGGEGGEERCEEHAHVSDVDGDVEEVQQVVKSRGGHHQTCTDKGFPLKRELQLDAGLL